MELIVLQKVVLVLVQEMDIVTMKLVSVMLDLLEKTVLSQFAPMTVLKMDFV